MAGRPMPGQTEFSADDVAKQKVAPSDDWQSIGNTDAPQTAPEPEKGAFERFNDNLYRALKPGKK